MESWNHPKAIALTCQDTERRQWEEKEKGGQLSYWNDFHLLLLLFVLSEAVLSLHAPLSDPVLTRHLHSHSSVNKEGGGVWGAGRDQATRVLFLVVGLERILYSQTSRPALPSDPSPQNLSHRLLNILQVLLSFIWWTALNIEHICSDVTIHEQGCQHTTWKRKMGTQIMGSAPSYCVFPLVWNSSITFKGHTF